jgi:hypothetical protein
VRDACPEEMLQMIGGCDVEVDEGPAPLDAGDPTRRPLSRRVVEKSSGPYAFTDQVR